MGREGILSSSARPRPAGGSRAEPTPPSPARARVRAPFRRRKRGQQSRAHPALSRPGPRTVPLQKAQAIPVSLLAHLSQHLQ